MTDTLEPIKTELFRNIDSLVNEIELCFDEINVDQINKYIKELKKDKHDNFDNFVKETYTHLHEYEKQLSLILFSNKKIRTPEYIFIDNIKLFKVHSDSKEDEKVELEKDLDPSQSKACFDLDPSQSKACFDLDTYLLNFSIFSKENKNTKKSLLKYIYNIYMSCFFLQSTANPLELSNFISNITNYSHPASDSKDLTIPIEEISIPSIFKLPNMEGLPDIKGLPDIEGLPDMESMMRNMMGMMGNMGGPGGPGMGGLDNLMSSLMNNSDIMNIANEISSDMKNDNFNPMELMAGMMSGNMTDGPLGNLMSKIQTSVNSKINSGEINEEALKEQAHNIINKVQETPGLSDILNKK